MSHREILSAIAIALTVGAYFPYVRGVVKGVIRPHVFSWLVWGITATLVFLAQLDAGAGVGVWSVGLSAAMMLAITVVALGRRADLHITRMDWAFLIAALCSLPLWLATSDPTWAVVVLTVITLLGYGPTLRKVRSQPHTESIPFFALFTIRNVLIILSLERYSLATLLFPCTVTVAMIALMVHIVVRRRTLDAARRDAPRST